MKYFTVSESPGGHVATIKADISSQLNKAIRIACIKHFDSSVIIPELEIIDYMHGSSGTIEISIGTYNTEIFIQQTWIY